MQEKNLKLKVTFTETTFVNTDADPHSHLDPQLYLTLIRLELWIFSSKSGSRTPHIPTWTCFLALWVSILHTQLIFAPGTFEDLHNIQRKDNVPRATVPQKPPCIKDFPFQLSSNAFLTATTVIISTAIISSTLCMFTELYVYVYRIICVCLHNYMCMFT